ncbi:hypothetical protein, partial [Vibrio parahaemolyticus]
EPLHKFYIYDTNEIKSYVRVYNPETDQPATTMEETYQSSLELEFFEDEDKVTINLDYHIYLDDDC